MNNACRLIVVFFSILVVFSCKQEPMLSISSSKTLSFKENGGSETISFITNNEWKASVSDSWVSLSSTSGGSNSGGQSIILSCSANSTYDERKCEVTITSESLIEKISITQEQGNAIILDKQLFEISCEGGNANVKCETNINDIEVQNGYDWITVEHSSSKGLHTESITFIVANNPTYEQRVADISIISKSTGKNQSVKIIQNAKPPINLSANGTANSYIVPVTNDKYSISVSVKGNGVEEIIGGKSASIVWDIDGVLFGSNHPIQNLEYDEYDKTISFYVNSIGNALVSVNDSNGDIIWSWLLWVTDYNPNKDNNVFVSSAIMMSRNLGSFSDYPQGLCFQWGRKDPFLYFFGKTHTVELVGPNNGSIEYVTKHPDVVMNRNLSTPEYDTWDWNLEHSSYWDRVKTKDDPCPTGWKVSDGQPGFWTGLTPNNPVEYLEKGMKICEPISIPSSFFPFGNCAIFTDSPQLDYQSGSYWTNSGGTQYIANISYLGKMWHVSNSDYKYQYSQEAWSTNARVHIGMVRCQREDTQSANN